MAINDKITPQQRKALKAAKFSIRCDVQYLRIYAIDARNAAKDSLKGAEIERCINSRLDRIEDELGKI